MTGVIFKHEVVAERRNINSINWRIKSEREKVAAASRSMCDSCQLHLRAFSGEGNCFPDKRLKLWPSETNFLGSDSVIFVHVEPDDDFEVPQLHFPAAGDAVTRDFQAQKRFTEVVSCNCYCRKEG